MVNFNRSEMRDRINACWIGKNIGGTLGGPYERNTNILDVKGFVTTPGEPLVNDDLDLQLVWLLAVEHLGLQAINEKVLSEYWLTYITPHWNEYGICKSNMRAGVAAPMSGELNNETWKHSNGAWIRTEIWATLFPGQPEEAVKYAYYDSCVDHGFGEGTYSAIFVAAMESAAFVTSDINELLNIGLSKIPENCRVAKSIKTVIEEYNKGTDWKVLRNMLVEQSRDIGWFQAPANVAFAVLGMLYGECDFKKSMLLAVNCGDDTDCTAATVGSVLGLMYGMKGIPTDWKDFIGDKIVEGCLLYGEDLGYAKSCSELTDRIMQNQYVNCRLSPISVTDNETDISEVDTEGYKGSDFADSLAARSPYTITESNSLIEATLELDAAPYIAANEKISGKITLNNVRRAECTNCLLRWFTTDGFAVTGNSHLHLPDWSAHTNEHSIGTFEITAPEKVMPENSIILEISIPGRPTRLYIPIILWSK